MDNSKFNGLVQRMLAGSAGLLVSKGDEYANDADRLQNFKRNAARNRQTVIETWATYINKHIDSVHSYVERVQDEATRIALQEVCEKYMDAQERNSHALALAAVDPADFRACVDGALPLAIKHVDAKLSEPIEGRFLDIINYCLLGNAIITEIIEKNGPKGYSV